MRPVLLASAAALALAACGGEKTADSAADLASEQTTAAVVDKPELGSFGVDMENVDAAVAPGEDFYRYVNGRWLDTFNIPDDFSSYGSFTVLFERAEARVKAIIEEAARGEARSDGARRIGDFYSSYLDEGAIEAAGLRGLADDFAAIDKAETHEDLARLMADPARGLEPVIAAYVDVDAKRPDRYVVYLTQSGLGLPNRDYYLDEKFADKRIKYQEYVEAMLDLADVPGAPDKAEGIFALEELIAKVHWEPAKRRNRDLTYNLKTREALEAFAPGMPWSAAFASAGLDGAGEFVVREDDAVAGIAAIFAKTPVDLWQHYFKFHLLRTHADVLPKAFDDATFAFYGAELRGAVAQRDRWKRAVGAVNDALGEAVGEIYVARHFPPASKAKMEDLVGNLRGAFAERLAALPWMSETTKAEAASKLEKFVAKIGHPEEWKDYSALEVVRADALGNARRAAAWAWRRDVAKLAGPVDRTEWFMTPQTVNAYYSPNRNEIVFPAAILEAPFFDPHADAAVNYGAIGAVIGHEIGHGFDDQGRKSDGEGVLRDWWTQSDAENFQALADRLGAQYAEYEPIPGFKVNPGLTMGENIGDLGGLSLAYHAYRRSLGGSEAPVIDGLTGDQRFFLSWAQVWKRVVRDEALKNQIATDPHSPARYRVNGVVRNMDEWYAAFDVKEGDALYLPPEARVSIW